MKISKKWLDEGLGGLGYCTNSANFNTTFFSGIHSNFNL